MQESIFIKISAFVAADSLGICKGVSYIEYLAWCSLKIAGGFHIHGCYAAVEKLFATKALFLKFKTIFAGRLHAHCMLFVFWTIFI